MEQRPEVTMARSIGGRDDRPPGSVRRWGARLVAGLFTSWLIVVLSGCGAIGLGAPPTAIVRRAVALQLLQTQTDLVQQLGPSDLATGRATPSAALPDRAVITLDDLAAEPGLRIDRLRVQQRQPIEIDGRPGWQLTGDYAWSQRDRPQAKPQHQQAQQPFAVYLQRQPEGKTWRLARPDPARSTPDRLLWLTYRL